MPLASRWRGSARSPRSGRGGHAKRSPTTDGYADAAVALSRRSGNLASRKCQAATRADAEAREYRSREVRSRPYRGPRTSSHGSWIGPGFSTCFIRSSFHSPSTWTWAAAPRKKGFDQVVVEVGVETRLLERVEHGRGGASGNEPGLQKTTWVGVRVPMTSVMSPKPAAGVG